jgi:UDP-N-acetylmuramate: L-alanyl-gamma-D-glutamyl-meso-diaminopimelate ligase
LCPDFAIREIRAIRGFSPGWRRKSREGARQFHFWDLRDRHGLTLPRCKSAASKSLVLTKRLCPDVEFPEKRALHWKEGYRVENIHQMPMSWCWKRSSAAIPKRGGAQPKTRLSLPEVLRNYFLRGRHNLVVTGTHGKTTTTALLAWIMEKAGRKPGYLIGGLPKNFGQGARLNDSKYFVIEGDEYDSAFFDKRSKFIHYLPELLIVNNIEFDHADIFNNLAEIKLSFRRLLNIVPQNGMVLVNGDDPNCVEVAKDCLAPMIEVGLSKNCAQRIRDVAYSGGSSRFKLGEDVFEIPLIGEFNVRNAAMAAIAARFYDVPKTKITMRSKLFPVSPDGRKSVVKCARKVIDDFGHHPTAIAYTLQALRQRYRSHRLWAIFEPRSNTTRRAVFQQQLPDALKLADGVLIAQVARLEQIPEKERLNPKALVDAIAKAGHPAFYEKNAAAIVDRIVPMLKAQDVVVVFSNGGFDNIHEKLLTGWCKSASAEMRNRFNFVL